MQMGGAYTMVRHAGRNVVHKHLHNTDGTIKKKDNPRKTGNIVYIRRRKTKQKHNAICAGYHYT